MSKGRLVLSDVETGVIVNVTFETMMVRGDSSFQVGEPFYYIDVVAEVSGKGISEKIVLVDRKETLKRIRPFLMNL